MGLLVAMGLAWTVTGAAPAQGQAQPMAATKQKAAIGDYLRKRLVQEFSFEEAKRGNFEKMPINWYAIGRSPEVDDKTFLQYPLHVDLIKRSGHPRYSEVRFNKSQREKGNHSLYLGMNGGNVGAFLEVGTIPAVPGSDYMVTANVRTDKLRHARARLCAYFIDVHGRTIKQSIKEVGDIDTMGEWHTVAVKLQGVLTNAAWIGLQVELLQPTTDPQGLLGKHQVTYRDIDAGAWFDDIRIWQVPRVTIRTQTPVNIIRKPERPILAMEVRDLTGQSLVADVAVYDHALNPVASTRQHIGRGDPTSWKWSPPLKNNGWYLVDLVVFETPQKKVGEEAEPEAAPKGESPGDETRTPAKKIRVARALGAFLWLGDEGVKPQGDGRKFTLSATDVPMAQLALLPGMLKKTDLQSTAISAWDRETSVGNVERRLAELDSMLSGMLDNDVRVRFSFFPIPHELIAKHSLPSQDPVWMFSQPFAVYRPYLAPVLRRYGQRIRQWQMGEPVGAETFFAPQLPDLTRKIFGDVRSLAPQPQLILPWRISQPPMAPLVSEDRSLAYQIDLNPAVRPDDIPKHLEAFGKSPAAPFALQLRTRDATQMAHPQRVRDFAIRMIRSWQVNPEELVLRQPWAGIGDQKDAVTPDPLLGVFSSVAHRLAGRRVLGQLPVAYGVNAVILDGDAGGALVLWNVSAPPEDAVLKAYLGETPVQIDVFGNRGEVPMVDGKHRIAIGTTPVFIEGIDAQLALFRASFKLDDPFIESKQVPHTRHVIIHNPWKRLLSGSMLIVEPSKWKLTPRISTLSIPPGETVKIPIRLLFPVSEVAGKKALVARFTFSTDDRYKVTLSTPVEVGLPFVKFDASLSWKLNPKTGKLDAIVTQVIHNTGKEPLSLYAFASLAGYPRQERVISKLDPGRSIVRRFTFPDAGDKIKQQKLRVGLREANGPAILNQVLKDES